MKRTITLKNLELKNFRGQNHVANFNGSETKISGKNGIGKSTLAKSWYWLLSGYPSPTETKNFNLFDNRTELSPDTPLASVKATLDIDGSIYTVERAAKCQFVRKRGSAEYEKASSDTYTIKIDEIEVQAKDFDMWLETNIAPKDMLVYCLDGGFFTELLQDDKNKARNVLESVVGEISDSDMKGDYTTIREDMARYTVEQIEERTKTEVKPYKKRADEIPAIIDDKQNTLAEYESIDFAQIATDIEKTKADIADLDSAILGKGKEIAPIMGERNRILNIINEKLCHLQKVKNDHLSAQSDIINRAKIEIENIKAHNAYIKVQNDIAKREHEKNIALIGMKNKELVSLEEKRSALLTERDEIKSRVFTADKCAYCGQELPSDVLEEAKNKFNRQKQSDYENVVTRGKNIATLISDTTSDISNLEKAVAKGYVEQPYRDMADAEAALNKAQSEFIPFENTQEYARLKAEISSLEATLPEIPNNDASALTEAKKVLIITLEELSRKYGLKIKREEIRCEIAKLQGELRSVGIEIARLEGKIDKCKEYKQERANIVSYRVNDKLTECTINMWNLQKDGTIKPDIVLNGKDGIRYFSLNFAHQIRAKVELQQLFMKAFNVQLPIWVDEFSVFDSTQKPQIDGQSIFLFASDSPYLTVE